jgi:hypothetical protein
MTPRPEVALFAYPWDIRQAGAGAFVSAVSDLGVDRVYVATRYHSAEILMPRREAGVLLTADEYGYHLPLKPETFTGIAPPAGSAAAGDAALFDELCVAAARADLGVCAWIVGLHASSLARAYPGSALVNCFGDVSSHFLCPADPACVRYLEELVAGTLSTRLFASAFLEGFCYGLLGHGHPHELHGVRLDPVRRYLASLCFCRSCLDEGRRRGIDGDAVRAWAAAELRRAWNGPLAPVRDKDDGAELAAMLATHPGVAAWTQMRCEVVTGLADRLAGVARSLGAETDLSAAIWARPAHFNWMEGVDLAAAGRLADRVVLECYYPSAGEIARELDHALSLLPPEKLTMTVLLWHDYLDSYDDLRSKIDLALSAGVTRFAFYNWATAPAVMLDWLPRISTHIASECARKSAVNHANLDRREILQCGKSIQDGGRRHSPWPPSCSSRRAAAAPLPRRRAARPAARRARR